MGTPATRIPTCGIASGWACGPVKQEVRVDLDVRRQLASLPSVTAVLAHSALSEAPHAVAVEAARAAWASATEELPADGATQSKHLSTSLFSSSSSAAPALTTSGSSASLAAAGSFSPAEIPPSTASSSSSCRPWSHADFLDRLGSYRVATWFAKPQRIDPLVCARSQQPG